ncbi:MAG: cysteine desulfurase [Phycisphaerales bacterium]|nr:cysteine desulfurase [Phycisphaerales bacterium]
MLDARAALTMIYLDHNATTQPLPEVVEAMAEMLREHWHNPSSIHRAGQAARQRVELARKSLAGLIGTRPRFLTLTGSGTESLDLAVRGHLLARGLVGAARAATRGAEPPTIITSPIEHIGIRELAKALEREEGVRVLTAGLDGHAVVSVDSVRGLLDEHPAAALVSVQWANNETGAIQPVGEIGRLCRERGVTFHCDATQWVGKMPTRVAGDAETINGAEGPRDGRGRTPSPLVCDLLTFSAHKFHGPKGVGVLYARAGIRTAPLIHGEQEMGRRGGTENVPGIVGAGVAAQMAVAWLGEPEGIARVERLRDRFELAVLGAVPEARVNGAAGSLGRLYNTSSIGFPRLEAEALLLLLSERGVCCSAGAACSSGSLEASAVIKAMKVPTEYAHGTLRFSLSRETTEAEVDEAARIVGACVERLKASWKPA